MLLATLTGSTCAGSERSSEDSTTYQQELDDARARVESLLPTASALQQQVLDDSYVTPAEADKTAADVIDCAAKRGVTTMASWDSGDHTMAFNTRIDNDETMAVFDDCWESRYSLVGETLAIQYALSDSQVKRLEDLMIECLAKGGIEIDRWPSADVDPAVESMCYDNSSAQL